MISLTKILNKKKRKEINYISPPLRSRQWTYGGQLYIQYSVSNYQIHYLHDYYHYHYAGFQSKEPIKIFA